jgi:hypothetical protein
MTRARWIPLALAFGLAAAARAQTEPGGIWPRSGKAGTSRGSGSPRTPRTPGSDMDRNFKSPFF